MKVTQKMKNFLKGRKLKGRYLLLGGLFLAAAFLAVPQHALAQWYLNALSSIFSPFISGLLKLLLLGAGAFLGLMNQLVGWAIGNPFNISYTRPGPTPPDNFIIEIGWTLLRDLVNMGFILGLAYIGLSTALDFGNKFNTAKTFRNLILIALLINFTPAICGAVVDMGNILGSFFTQGTDFSTINDMFNRQQGKISADWANILSDGNILLNAVMLIIFGFASAIVLFVYLVLFIARGPMIWILVILSPVAFFAFIFDKTKKEFGKWWDKFIQWALIIPVVLGFFLYLSQQVLVRVNEVMNASGSSPSGFINQIVPYALPMGFLALGLFLGTTVLIPKGGAAVVGLATTAGAAAVGAAGTGVKMASSAAGKGIGAAGSGIKGVGSGIDMAGNAAMKIPYIGGVVGGGLKAIGGTVKIAGSATKLAGSAVTRAGKDVGNTIKDTGKIAKRTAEGGMKRLGIGKGSTQAQTGLESTIAELRDASAATQQAAMNNAIPGVEGSLNRIAGTMAAIESGNGLENLNISDRENVIRDTAKLVPEQMPTIKNIAPETIAKIIKETRPSEERQKQMGVFITKEEIAKFSGHQYADKDGGEKSLLPLAAKIMAEIKPDVMSAWTPDIANKAASSGIANQFWSGSQISKAAELFGSKFVDIFKKNIKSEDFYAQNNTPMGSFINSSPGQALNLKFNENTAAAPNPSSPLADNPTSITKKRQTPQALAQRNPEKNLDSNISPKKAA